MTLQISTLLVLRTTSVTMTNLSSFLWYALSIGQIATAKPTIHSTGCNKLLIHNSVMCSNATDNLDKKRQLF